MPTNEGCAEADDEESRLEQMINGEGKRDENDGLEDVH